MLTFGLFNAHPTNNISSSKIYTSKEIFRIWGNRARPVYRIQKKFLAKIAMADANNAVYTITMSV